MGTCYHSLAIGNTSVVGRQLAIDGNGEALILQSRERMLDYEAVHEHTARERHRGHAVNAVRKLRRVHDGFHKSTVEATGDGRCGDARLHVVEKRLEGGRASKSRTDVSWAVDFGVAVFFVMAIE